MVFTSDSNLPQRIDTVARDVDCTHLVRRACGKRQKDVRQTCLGSVEVQLSSNHNKKRRQGPKRWLLVAWSNDSTPLVLLTSIPLTTLAAMEEVFDAYHRRWKIEETNRAIKQVQWGVRLEDMRALTLRATRRLALFAVLYYGFLAILRDRRSTVIDAACRAAPTGSDEQLDPRYRIVRGMGTLLGSMAPRAFRSWRAQM